jgi:hypothetical protein
MENTSSRITEYDENYETCERCYAVFRIFSGSISPDIITANINIIATCARSKGELLASKTGRKRIVTENKWFLSSEEKVLSKDLRCHLDWLLEKLYPSLEAIRQLQEKPDIKMNVICNWWSALGGGGPVLWPEQMSRLAELNLECAFSFVDYNDEDESSQPG